MYGLGTLLSVNCLLGQCGKKANRKLAIFFNTTVDVAWVLSDYGRIR